MIGGDFIKTKTLNRMYDELDTLKRRIKLIEKLEIKPVNEKTWHEICLTPVRYEKDLMLSIAKETFPLGENFVHNPNEIKFTLNGFNVEIPICAINGIKIDTKWFKPLYGEPPKEYRRFENMRKYFELLDSGNCKWYDLACCRCNNEYFKSSKFKMFLWWFCKAKWRKVDRKKWEDMFEHEDSQIKNNLENHNKKVEEIEEKLNNINYTIDILKEFAEVKGYVNSNGFWAIENVENYFR